MPLAVIADYFSYAHRCLGEILILLGALSTVIRMLDREWYEIRAQRERHRPKRKSKRAKQSDPRRAKIEKLSARVAVSHRIVTNHKARRSS